MNGGLIALIVFGCIFTLYVVIGTIVRYRSGLHRCPEVLPNYYFWCSILNVVLRVVSCGRWRILCNRNNHTNDVYVLPSHPGATDRVQFELLVSDVDENYDVSRAMHPAEASMPVESTQKSPMKRSRMSSRLTTGATRSPPSETQSRNHRARQESALLFWLENACAAPVPHMSTVANRTSASSNPTVAAAESDVIVSTREPSGDLASSPPPLKEGQEQQLQQGGTPIACTPSSEALGAANSSAFRAQTATASPPPPLGDRRDGDASSSKGAEAEPHTTSSEPPMQPPRPAGLVGLRRHLVVADALPLFNALLAGRLGPVAVDVQLQGHTRLLQHPQQFEAALKAYEKQSASELREALSSVQPFFLLCNAGGGADCSANPLEMSGSGTASDGHPQATPGTAMLSTSPVLYTMSPANNYPVLPLLAHLLRAQRVTKLLFHSRLLYRLLFLFLGTDRVEVSSVVDVPTWTTLGQQLRPSLALLFHVPMEGVKHLSDLMTVLPLEMQQMLNEETQSIAQQQQREQRPCDGAGSARSLDDSVPDTLEDVSTGDSDVAGCRKSGEEDELIDAVQILERIRPFAEPPLNGNKNSASGTACTDPDSDFRSAGVKHRPSRSHQRRCGRRCDSDPHPSSPPHADMPYLADVYNGLKTVTLFFTHVLSRLIDVVDPGAAGVAEPHAGVATMPLLTSRYGSEAIESPVSALRHRLAPSEVCALRTYADFLCEIMAYHGVFVNHTMAREMLTLLDVQMAAIEELGLRVAATLLAGTEPTTFSKTLAAVESSKWNIQMVLQCLTRLHAAATTAEMPQVLDVHHLRFLSTQAKQSSDQQAAQLGLGCLLVCAWMAYLDRASMKNRLLGMFSKVSEKLHLHVLEHPRDVATADIGAAPGAPTAHAPRVCYSVHPDWVLHNKSTGRIFSALPNVQNLPKQPPRTTFQVHALSVTQGRGGSSSSSSGETPHPCGYVDPPTTEDIDGWLSLAEAGAADQASSAQFLLFPEHPEWTLRHLYCAPPGCVLISFDYNQLELRLLAHLSGDAALQEHLSANVDVLALVTASVLNLPSIDHVHPSQRQAVKVIVYGLLYGMGQELMDVRIKKINEEFAAAGRRPHREGEEPPSVAPPVSATDLLGRFYKAYPRIERYLRETRQEALRSFAVETLSGRKSLVAEADANRRKQRAIAQAVQGGAADVLQSAMRAVHERRHRFLPYLPAASLALVMSIHDELVYAVPRVATDVVVREVQRILEGQARALRLAVPLPVSVRIGHSFGELTEYRFAEA